MQLPKKEIGMACGCFVYFSYCWKDLAWDISEGEIHFSHWLARRGAKDAL